MVTLSNCFKKESLMKTAPFARLRTLLATGSRTNLQKRKPSLAAKQRAFRVEFLETRQVMAGDISGVVFNDANGNGIDEAVENGLPGWTVFVDSNGNARQDAGEPFAITDDKGKYLIPNLPTVATTVYEIPQDGYRPTPGFSDHITVTVREGREVKAKFPNVAAPVATGQIVGSVYEDINENSVFEATEEGLEGWTVYIDSNSDGVFNVGEPITTVDADGGYQFAGIVAGSVTVVEVPQGGLQPTVGGLFPTTGTSDRRTVTVPASGTVRSDFANIIPQVGNLQGNVWNDANGDGLRVASEVGLAGRTVYIDLNLNGSQDPSEPVRTTDAAGAYAFSAIRRGSYRVIESIAAPWIAAEGKPTSVMSTVFLGGTSTVDFFNLIPVTGSLQGVLWDDANGNGLQEATESRLAGWQVYVDANANGSLDASDPQAVSTSVGGYTIAGVAYGTSSVRIVVPSNFAPTNPASGAQSIKLLNGENKVGVNFGSREKIGTIQGTLWNDADGDRLRGATEGPLSGWTVYLDLNSDGIVDAGEPTTTTSATGSYLFTRVPVGTYSVTDVVQPGWLASIGKPSTVSVAVSIGGVQVVDFYNLQPVPGSISGVIWNDLDSNGLQAATEPFFESWQVYADLNNNNTLDAGEPQAISNAAGVYSLSDIPYGNNTIREIIPPGYKSTNYPNGTTNLFLFNGENRTGVSFGNHEPADFVISGTAYYDANHNGLRDAGERGLSGITVFLDLNDNGVLDVSEPKTITSVDQFFTPTSNEAGQYTFTHLARGNYKVREILPIELDATPVANRQLLVNVGPLSRLDADFANLYRANEIHGVVFDDTDEDGIRDGSEYARPGVGVYLDLNRDDLYDIDEPETTTGEDGSYAFTGLTPGAYIVRERSGFSGRRTYPTTGGGVLMPTGTSNPAQGNVTPGSISTVLSNGQSYTQTVSLTLPGSGTGITNLVDVFLLFDDTGSFTSNSPIVRAAFPTIISSLQASLPGVDLGFGVGRFEEYGSFASEFATGRPFILNQPIVAASTAGFSTSIQAALDRMAPGYGGDGPETDIEALYQVVTGLGFDGNNNGSVLDSGAAGLASTQLSPGASGDVPSFASFQADPGNNVLRGDGNVGGAGFRPGALPIILTATDIGFAYQPKGETNIIGTGGLSLPVSALTQTSRGSTPFSSGAGLQETVTGLNALGALVIGLGTNPNAAADPRLGLESLAKLTGAVNRTTSTIANGTADPIAPGDPFYFQISNGFGSTVATGITNAIQNAVTNVALDITLRASDPHVRLINHSGTRLGVGSGQTASFDIEFVGDGRPHRFDLQFVREGTNVVVGSIPVVIGTPIAGEGYSYDDLEDGEIHRSSHFGHYIANVAPSFVGGADQTVLEDVGVVAVAGWATNISAGPASESAQSLNFIVTNSNPSLFSVQPSIAANGTLTFTPAANANGSAIVSVQLHDNGGVGSAGADTSLAQTFRIDVTAVADTPVASGDSFSLTQGSSLTVPISGVLANDTDADGDALTAALVTAPAHGSVTLNGDGSFTYTPDLDYFGSDSFSYTATDGTFVSAPATVTLTINRINHAPVANPDSYSTNQNTPLSVPAAGLLINDSDADGDALTVTRVAGPAHGTLTLNADGSFLYTPTLNYAGPDSFTYQVSDGSLNSAVVAVTLGIISTNSLPVANGDSYSTNEDTLLSVPAAGIVANDTDADGNALAAALVSGPLHGILALSANGAFEYRPTLNYAGPDSFTYKVNDGMGDSNIATVTIDVSAINDAPGVGNDSYSIAEDNLLNVSAPGVLTNDSDVEGSALSVALVSGPTRGTLTLNSNGSFSYQPNANANGIDSFTYRANDGTADSAIATVTINVAAVNDAPLATGESYSTSEDVPLSVAAPGVLANDSDIEGSVLRPVLVSGPVHGTLTLNANGSFVYTPASNYSGPDSFTYRANDGLLSSTNIATVNIAVTPVNDVPVASNDSYSTTQNSPLTVPARGVLINDTDADGDVLTAAVATGPSNGTLVMNADGSFTYTPNSGFNGRDSFTYQAADATAQSALATVTITVLAPPPPGPKFFVVDATSKGTFKYDAEGRPLDSHLLDRSDSKPRGIASNPAGTIQWVIDGGGNIFVYSNTGTLLGQWTPSNVGKPEGITVWGNDLWLVDPNNDRVYMFTGGATRRSGRVAPTSSFALNAANRDAKDIVTDGVHHWIVNDTLGSDRVFRYLVNGTLEGSWALSVTNPTPTGITIDPNNVNHIWVVDSSSDRVLQYSDAASRLSGSQEPAVTFALAAGNGDAQGIADPMPAPMTAINTAIGEDAGGGDVGAVPLTFAEYKSRVDDSMASWDDEMRLQLTGDTEKTPSAASHFVQPMTSVTPIEHRRFKSTRDDNDDTSNLVCRAIDAALLELEDF